jgi:hypothetical protein
MEIKIKRIGYKVGTVGWLAAGLQDGSILITEGTLKSNGNHGLWLKVSGNNSVSQFLASFDRFGVGDELHDAAQYQTADECNDHADREAIWTDAAWDTLMAIAADWCEMCNSEREADKPATLKIVHVV